MQSFTVQVWVTGAGRGPLPTGATPGAGDGEEGGTLVHETPAGRRLETVTVSVPKGSAAGAVAKALAEEVGCRSDALVLYTCLKSDPTKVDK